MQIEEHWPITIAKPEPYFTAADSENYKYDYLLKLI